MSASTEVIKLTAIPSGVDSNNFYVSVVLSPELTGGDGTIARTDFEKWPDTLNSWTQNGAANYYPAYWDVVLSDGGGSKLYEQTIPLDASRTNEALWESIFPATTEFEGPDAAQSRSARTKDRAG